MGKRKLMTGIIVGASIGGLISLMNEDARKYAKEKANEAVDNVQQCIKNPAETVKQVREKVETLNEAISSNASSAVNALEQVENSLNKLLPPKKD